MVLERSGAVSCSEGVVRRDDNRRSLFDGPVEDGMRPGEVLRNLCGTAWPGKLLAVVAVVYENAVLGRKLAEFLRPLAYQGGRDDQEERPDWLDSGNGSGVLLCLGSCEKALVAV